MQKKNPFHPTAGATPPLLVGRSEQLQAFDDALHNGPGDPGLLTLITGPRGIGKTVMLTEFGEIARSRGWHVIDDTATAGLLERIDARVEGLRSQEHGPRKGSVTGITIGKFGIVREPAPVPQLLWRERIEHLLDSIEARGSGLLITIDEIHAIAEDDLVQLAADVQHLIRDERSIALAVAGLPRAVEDLLNRDVSTFLRRADRLVLDSVDIDDIKEALMLTFAESGITANEEDIRTAAQATQGYPFMIQLVGYHLWRLSAESGVLDRDSVVKGIDAARVRLGALVHETALADLSDVDKSFLIAMTHEDGPIRTGRISEALGRNSNYVSVYRERLIKAGMIRSTSYGYVDFALPYLRDYLREHAASMPTTALDMDGDR